MIYFLVFFIMFLPVLKYDIMAKTGEENRWFYFNLLVLILFAGLRYRVGSDTLMYMSVFGECPTLTDLKYFDFAEAKYNPLWYVLNAVARSIYDDFTVLQLIHSIIVNCSFFWFFRKYCPKYYFSAILIYYVGYFCYFNMEIMRESLCISVLLLAIPFLIEKNWVRYILMCVVGLLIHYSAAIMFVFPLLFLFFKKASWKIAILMFAVVIFIAQIVNIPMLLLNLFGLNEQLIMLISTYIDEQRNIMGIISEIVNYLPILICIWLCEKNKVLDKNNFTPIIMGTAMVYALAMSIGIFSRFINYFIPFIIIYMINTIYRVFDLKMNRSYSSYLLSFFMFFVFCFNMIRFYANDASDVLPNTRAYVRYHPYYSVLNPKIDDTRESFIENSREVIINF